MAARMTWFVSGFFSDSLCRSAVDVDYYASLGGYAYQQLSTLDSGSLAPAFDELGRRFLALDRKSTRLNSSH